MCDIVPVKFNAAGSRSDQAGNHVEDRRLAGAVGTKQADGFSTLYGERHILDDCSALERPSQVPGNQPALAAEQLPIACRPRSVRWLLPSSCRHSRSLTLPAIGNVQIADKVLCSGSINAIAVQLTAIPSDGRSSINAKNFTLMAINNPFEPGWSSNSGILVRRRKGREQMSE